MKRHFSLKKERKHSRQRKTHKQRYGTVYPNCRRATGWVGRHRKGERAQREETRDVEVSSYKWSCFYKDKKFRLCPFGTGKSLKDLNKAIG